MPDRLVVIGGNAAGMSAASQARRRRGQEDLEIIAFDRGHFTSYSSCGIPYFVVETVAELDDLVVRTPEQFRDRHQIRAFVRSEVVDLDLDGRRLTVSTEGKANFHESFDEVVIATGATPARPDWTNGDARGIFGVQTLDDGMAIKRYLDDEQVRHAVVVGGGYIGLEMAEALVSRGFDVSLVEMAPQPMSTLDPDMGALVGDALKDIGIHVFTSEPVAGFETRAGRVSGVVTDERTIPADVVVLGLGMKPSVELAEAAGVPIGHSGAIEVDRRMRTSVEGVWAVGDCAEKFHRIANGPVAIALGTHANKEGRVAGINIGGGYATFPGVIGTAASKVCDYEVARTGLKESEAERAGFRYLTTTVDSTTRAGYFPGAQPIKTKLIVERNSGLLLGAQIIGREGAAKRIDALATALWSGMTVDEMLNLDLAYAPPFAPVWDPVLIAARKAWQAMEEG